MAAPIKPQIQQYSGGYSATGCVLDLDNRFSKNVVELKARAERGTTLNMLNFQFIPNVEQNRGLVRQASADIGTFSPSFLEFRHGPNTWEKIVWKPGKLLVPGLLKGKARFQGPAGTHEEKVEIRIKAAGPRMLYLNKEARDVLVTLKHQSGNTQNYTHEEQGKFAFEGPVGCRVRLKLTWDGRECGHYHDDGSSDPNATGWFNHLKEPHQHLDLLGKDRKISVEYTSKGVCGDVTVRASFYDNRWNLIRTQTMILKVRYKLLTKLPDDSPYYVKIDNMEVIDKKNDTRRDPLHPAHLYGTTKLVEAIEKLAQAFYEEFDKLYLELKAVTREIKETDQNASGHKYRLPNELKGQYIKYLIKSLKLSRPHNPEPGWAADAMAGEGVLDKGFLLDCITSCRPVKLRINDMSLPYGGRFDICATKNKPFVPDHQLHMFGEHVDISYNGLSEYQIERLKALSNDYFSRCTPEDDRNHIHLLRL